MVADVYSHIIDNDRWINAQQFEKPFYQAKTAPLQEKASESVSGESISQAASDQELLMKLLANPEMATLLKSLVKNL